MAQFIVITHPDQAAGFRLAGVQTYSAASNREAHEWLLANLDDLEIGIIAIDQRFLNTLDKRIRRRIDAGYRPVVIGIPEGGPDRGSSERRQQMTEMIRRAIGVRISFGSGEE